jgi:hypothetical protein
VALTLGLRCVTAKSRQNDADTTEITVQTGITPTASNPRYSLTYACEAEAFCMSDSFLQ